MNYYLLVSAILMAIMGIAHSVVGEIKILQPLESSKDLPAVRGSTRHTRLTLRFTWHITTVLGFGIAAILFLYSQAMVLQAQQVVVVQIFSITFFISFLVSLIGSRARHPSWIVFLIASVLTWLA